MEESKHTVICPNCGGAVLEDARFCGMCGSSTMTVNSDPHIGQTVAGRYDIKEKIASGGMGEIYIAEHQTLSQRVAVKLLHRRYASDERIVARFFNEARSYCRVKHPHAVSLLDFGRLPEGTLYIVTEFVEGDVLSHFVRARTRLGSALTVRLTRQLGEVLAAAHAEQIVHRDLKPDNIIITEAPGGRFTAKLLDFGIAKILDDTEGNRLTQTGAVFGTPEFMSPEQAQGVPVGFSSDIYSLGAIVFFMLSGNAPFEGRDRHELIRKHVTEPPPMDLLLRGEDTPPQLVSFVQACLRKKPQDRPKDMLAVLSVLENIAADLSERPSSGDMLAIPVRIDEAPAAEDPAPAPLATKPDRGASEEVKALSLDTPDPVLELGEISAPAIEDELPLDGPDVGLLDAAIEEEDDGFTWGTGDEADTVGELADFEDDDISGTYSKPRRFSTSWLLLPLIIVAIVAAGYLYFSVFPSSSDDETSHEGSGQEVLEVDAGGTAAEADVPVEAPPEPLPTRPFAIVEASRVTANAAALLRSAEVDGAATAWSEASQLFEAEGMSPIAPVAAEIERAHGLVVQADEALEAGRCRRADEAIVEMRQISPELRRRYLGPLNRCNRRHRDRGLPPRTLE